MDAPRRCRRWEDNRCDGHLVLKRSDSSPARCTCPAGRASVSWPLRRLFIWRKGHRLEATHGRSEDLQRGMAEAERRLQRRNLARSVQMECRLGTKSINGTWGIPCEEYRKEHNDITNCRPGAIVAGFCRPLGARRYQIVVYCGPDFAPHPHTIAHECGHAILFEHGFPARDHHDIMKRVGL